MSLSCSKILELEVKSRSAALTRLNKHYHNYDTTVTQISIGLLVLTYENKPTTRSVLTR